MHLIEPQIDFARIAFGSLLDVSKDLTTVSLSFSEELEKIAKRVSVDELLNRLRARDAARRGVPFTPSPVAPPAVTAPWIREMQALDAALPTNMVGETTAIKRVLPRARRGFISRGLNQRGPAAVAPRPAASSTAVTEPYTSTAKSPPLQGVVQYEPTATAGTTFAKVAPLRGVVQYEPTATAGTTLAKVAPGSPRQVAPTSAPTLQAAAGPTLVPPAAAAGPTLVPPAAAAGPTLVPPAAAARASARVDPAAPTLIDQVSSPPPVASPTPAVQTGAPRRARMSRGRQATSAAPTQPVAGAPTQPVAGAPAAGDGGGLSNWYNNLSKGQRTALMAGGLAAGTGLTGFGAGYLLGDG